MSGEERNKCVRVQITYALFAIRHVWEGIVDQVFFTAVRPDSPFRSVMVHAYIIVSIALILMRYAKWVECIVYVGAEIVINDLFSRSIILKLRASG